MSDQPTHLEGAVCHKCGAPAFAELATGPPEHRWLYWCRPCLAAARRAYRAARGLPT